MRVFQVILCVALLAIGWGGADALARFSNAAAHRETFGFPAAYTAAQLVVHRDSSGSLQDWEWFRAQTRRLGFKVTDVFYGNPPTAALAMVPLAGLAPATARVVWTWLTLVLWAAGIGLFGWLLIARERWPPWVTIAGLLCLATLFAPLRSNLEEGQVYVLAFFFQTVCCWLWVTRRHGAAGAFGGMLMALKGYGLPLVVLAVLRRDWRFIRGAVAGFGAMAVAAWFALGFKQWIYFFGTYHEGRFAGIPTPALQTLKSFLAIVLQLPTVTSGALKILTPGADYFLFAVEAVLLLGALLWLSEGRWLQRRTGGEVLSPSYAALSACVLLNLVLSPRAEEHSYPLAMTAVLLALPTLKRISAAAALVIAGILLLSWPFHLQDRVPITTLDAVIDFARLWGAVVLLAGVITVEMGQRRGWRAYGPNGAGAYIACGACILMTLWYVKPWRDPVRSGPLLAVSQTDANRVMLLRLDLEEREIAAIPLTCRGPFGLAFSRRNWLHTACWNDAKISRIELRTRSERDVMTASRLPAWMGERRAGAEIWVSNEDRGTVSIYGDEGIRPLGETASGKGASDIAFNRDETQAWVSNEGDNTVSLIDAPARQRVQDVSVGKVPQGMALTNHGRELLVANFGSNTVSVVDTVRRHETGQIPVCAGPVDTAASSTGSSGLAFVSCFNSGSVGVLDLKSRQQVQEIAVGTKPFGIAMSSERGRVYVCVGGSNRLMVLEARKPSRILRKIPVEGSPLQIALAP